MTVETIEANRSMMIPAICTIFIRENIDGCGEEYAAEFARDYNEIFDLAEKQLEQSQNEGDIPEKWFIDYYNSFPEDSVSRKVLCQMWDAYCMARVMEGV